MAIVRIFTSRSGIGSGIGPGSGIGCRATGRYSVAWGLNTRASGNYSTASGYVSTASGNYSTASGYVSTASGNYSTASGSSSTASGSSSTASGNYSTASGYASTASGNYAMASGYVSTASGYTSTASGDYSIASGSSSTASRYGQRAYAAGSHSIAGDSQYAGFIARKITTDATPTELALDGSSAYLTIPAKCTMSGTMTLSAARTDVSGTTAAWPSIQFGIARDATGNCRLLGSVVGAGTTTFCDAGATTWSVAVTASASNRLAIAVTGEAGKTIRWTVTVDVAEVNY